MSAQGELGRVPTTAHHPSFGGFSAILRCQSLKYRQYSCGLPPCIESASSRPLGRAEATAFGCSATSLLSSSRAHSGFSVGAAFAIARLLASNPGSRSLAACGRQCPLGTRSLSPPCPILVKAHTFGSLSACGRKCPLGTRFPPVQCLVGACAPPSPAKNPLEIQVIRIAGTRPSQTSYQSTQCLSAIKTGEVAR